MASNPCAGRDRGHRVPYDRRSAALWESRLPPEVLRLPEELAQVDALLDDPAFFAPFAQHFHPVLGRPSTPVEWYLRLMFLKFRYRLGYESLCAEVSDSISWRRFCRIPLDGTVPHPTTLMKLTARCGDGVVAGLNEALLAKAAGQKLLRTSRLRVDTTVVPANVAYPTDSGLLARAIRRIAATGRRIQAAGGATRTRVRAAAGRPGSGRPRASPGRQAGRGRRAPGGCWPTPAARCAAPRRRRRPWPRPGSRTPPPGGGEADCTGRSMTWPDCWRSPSRSRRKRGSGSRARAGRGDPAGQPARAGRQANRQGPSRQTHRVRGTRPSSSTTASSPITPSSRAIPLTARSSSRPCNGSSSGPGPSPGPSPPTAATARRPSKTTCTDSGSATSSSRTRAKARQAAERRPAFRRAVKWRTGSEGRISTLKRQYGWDRARLDGTEGARIWAGHGVLAHNLVKISALAAVVAAAGRDAAAAELLRLGTRARCGTRCAGTW